MDIARWLQRCPIIAILRGIKSLEAESVCAALEKVGIAIVEVPLNSPDALSSISTLSQVFGSRMLIGAGTLTDSKQVTEVATAGGRLIVTPHADTEIVRAAKSAGLFAVPGFFNPTEAFALLRAGADAPQAFSLRSCGDSNAACDKSRSSQKHNLYSSRRNRRKRNCALDDCWSSRCRGRIVYLQTR